MRLEELTVHEAQRVLRSRQCSSVDLTTAVLESIERQDARVRAFVTVTPDLALSQARQADERFVADNAIPALCGIPLALKDNLCTLGVRTTCSSRMLENWVPPYDATVVRLLRESGSVFVGKTNLDEFAMGSSTENSAFFTTRNPWDLDRVPGGSSGGSAAAVAANEALAALGSDTGGSVRLPACFCGVVGLKPTYGRVSRYGLIAFGSSLDQIGPLTRDVQDAAIMLSAIAGRDSMDSTSVDLPVPEYDARPVESLRDMRIGIPGEYFQGLEAGVASAVERAVAALRMLGATVDEVSLPHTKYALSAYYIIAPAEASANLARYDGVRYGLSERQGGTIWDMFKQTRGNGFGPEVKRRIMLGTYALSSGYYEAYYIKAQKVRALIRDDFRRAFDRYDALVAPTSPTVAFRVGEKADDPLAMYQTDVSTVTVNAAGIPAISIPCGLSGGMPVGLQVLGDYFDEAAVLKVAAALENALGDWRKQPAS